MSMRVLKTGRKIGSSCLHAVVYINGRIKLACKSEGKWVVIQSEDFCPEVKQFLINQLF